METVERILNVLVVDDRPSERRVIEQALSDFGHTISAPDNEQVSLAEAVSASAADLVVVGADILDTATFDDIRAVASTRPILLFTNDGASETIRRATACGVAAFIVDGIKPSRLGPIIEAAIARFEQLSALRLEIDNTRHAAARRRRIDLAKGMLMCRHGIDEQTAHRQLLKTAMDRNLRLIDVAERVVVDPSALR